jgi:enolase-phosphatase E1
MQHGSPLTNGPLTAAFDAVVLDVEGTTTPVAFVYDVLFPFARRHLREHLRSRWTSDETRTAVRLLREEWAHDKEVAGQAPPPWLGDSEVTLSLIAAYAEWLMDRDRKSPGLKLLQGYIWEGGFRSGALTGQVFADVAPAFERWHRSGLAVLIYSSGSVLAQRLLFEHTDDGDLSPLITGFFDLEAGFKDSPDSYRRIAASLEYRPERLLFVSDSLKELRAAQEAGWQVFLCVRPGNPVPPSDVAFPVIKSFDEVDGLTEARWRR